MVILNYVDNWLTISKKNTPFGLPNVRPMLHLTDKLSLSIQASEFHYCIPRDNFGPYSHVEVAITGGIPKILRPYYDSGGVCGYVPVERINYLIHKHGGVKCISRPQRSSQL